jgi:hypothetical protein
MVITTRAVIVDSMIANLGFDLQYTANAAAGGVGIIQFVSGQITIKDISSGTFSGAMSAGPTVSSAGSNHTQRFDLSNYTTLVSPTYKYGEGNQRDTVILKLKYVWSKNFNAQSNFELMNFRGTHFAVRASPYKRVACDTFGDRAYLPQNVTPRSAASPLPPRPAQVSWPGPASRVVQPLPMFTPVNIALPFFGIPPSW